MKKQTLALLMAIVLALLPVKSLCENKADPSRSITVLLLGIDGKEGEARSAAAIVIAALNLDTGSVRLASLDRNILVPGDGSGERLGTAVAKDGPALAIQTVNSLFGTGISHLVSVDLSGMEKIIDAMGGVEIDVRDSEINILLPDGKTKAFQKAGMQTLGGAQALAYMKDHTGEEKGGSHLGRVLAACMQKGIQMGFDPLIELVSELMAFVETNMSLMDMMEVALSALSASISGMETKQFPVSRVEEALDKETVLRINSAAEAKALQAFLYGSSRP